MDAHLRAGVATYNDGHHHGAHDAWEDYWLDLESGTDDERFLHGLIQFTAAVHHGYGGNWVGLRGLAESAAEYLDGLPDDYRGVDLAAVRAYLRALTADPEAVERLGPLPLTVGGERLRLADLDVDAAFVAAGVLAEELPNYDETPVERAVAYARTDLAAGDEGSQFVTLVWDFVRDATNRGVVYQRLTEHVSKRRSRERDVDGLFE